MLRGNHPTRIDAKGRIKIHAEFRRYIDETYGKDFYVTSISGDHVRIYPLSVWIGIEEKLAPVPEMDPAKRKFLRRANFYGRTASMDGQGRLLIHPQLRNQAELDGEVAVLGQITFLEIWNAAKYGQQVKSEPYTDKDAADVASHGV